MTPLDGEAFFISVISLTGVSPDLLIAEEKSLGCSISAILVLRSWSEAPDFTACSLFFFSVTICCSIPMGAF
jgi:hypothetical protein